MHITGLIMAGGRSERMRSTLGPKHKALVPVLGVPMLEWNICSLLSRGIRRIVVASNAGEGEIEQYVRTRGTAMARAVGGTIASLIEAQPLGTIGAIRELGDDSDLVLVTNVDNLTTLNWAEMLAYHQRRRVGMTIAAHWQPFRIPLGELEISGGNVVKYHEKPLKNVLISSGTYVLNSEICTTIPKGDRMDVPELVEAVLSSGHSIGAFPHDCSWIDVNDAGSLADAERIVAGNFSTFGCWHSSPDTKRLHLLIRTGPRILIEKHSSGSPSDCVWELPGGDMSQTAEEAALSACSRLGFDQVRPQSLGAYDELEEHGESITRNHVFLIDAAGRVPMSVGADCTWIYPHDVDKLSGISSAMLRSVTLLRALQRVDEPGYLRTVRGLQASLYCAID